MVIPLQQLPKLAQKYAGEGKWLIKKADSLIGKDDSRSSSMLKQAAESLERAAHLAREYEREIFHPED